MLTDLLGRSEKELGKHLFEIDCALLCWNWDGMEKRDEIEGV